MLDWRGTPIVKDAIVIYPGRQSSSMWMVEAIVLDVTTKEHWYDVIPALVVQPIKTGRFHHRVLKPVTLTALERVTVIQSPNEIREPLHDVPG
jgi:hypothetical protein